MRRPLATVRGKSMLALSAMTVVSVLVQSIRPGIHHWMTAEPKPKGYKPMAEVLKVSQ